MSSNLVKNKQIPKGWLPTIIGDLLDFEYGKGLTKKKRNENGKFPVYGSNGIVGYHTNFLIEAPALIIGRKGAAGEVSYSDKNCWPIDTTYFINNLKYLNIKFVFYVLKSLRLNEYDRSTAIPGLNRNDAYELSFNLPPLHEQNQIVAKIEELFSELDNGIENLKKAREQLKTYRQAVLKYAFEGKLTKEWRTLQRLAGNPPKPAEKLLEQIKTEREKHYQKQLEDWKRAREQAKTEGKKKPTKPKKPKELPPLTEKELAELPELPKGWGWIKLKEVSDITSSKRIFKKDYVDEGISFYRTKEIKELSEGRNVSVELFISKEKYDDIKDKFSVPKPGDILISAVGTIGISYVIKDNTPFYFKDGNLIWIRELNKIESKFLSYGLTNFIRNKKQIDISGTAYNALTIERLKNFDFSLPPIKEQHAIISEIESRLSVCDKIEEIVEDSLKKAEALRQSILKKAFEGELTRDWREKHPELIAGENSGEKLLGRIKAEKRFTAESQRAQRKKLTL